MQSGKMRSPHLRIVRRSLFFTISKTQITAGNRFNPTNTIGDRLLY
ncbi:hypothetical protein [uncultured Nostoc sp.]